MKNNDLVDRIAAIVEARMKGEGSGHDWWHVLRVWNSAKSLGKAEKADMLIVELGALLHDIADWKFHDGDDRAGSRVSRELLKSEGVDEPTIEKVCRVVDQVSYKGAGVDTTPDSLEAKVVQDADRLDALGAIGVARAFAYGGSKSREMYNPDIPPVIHQTKEEYINSVGTTVNHFYEKLLLVRDRLNTPSAKKLANARHDYLESFLEEFYKEWNGEA